VRLWDVASARSTERARLLCQWNTSHRSSFCSFFDGHRSILVDRGVLPISSQHRPQCAVDDLAPTSSGTLLRLRQDGWIWLGRGKDERRACWVPPAYRSALPFFNADIATLPGSIMLVTDSYRFVLLDLKKWIESQASGS